MITSYWGSGQSITIPDGHLSQKIIIRGNKAEKTRFIFLSQRI
jgi:hypothetical protein